MNEGRIPEDRRGARMSGSPSTWACRALDVPHAHGGLALPVLTQVAIVEQLGRVTNALGWCYGEAQGWMFEACNDEQIERLVMPLMRGERHICYAITEENAGSDPAAIATTAERRRRALSAQRREVACHERQSRRHHHRPGDARRRRQ